MFSCEYCKDFKKGFFIEHSGGCLQRRESQQIFKEVSLLRHRNNFSFSTYFRIVWCIKRRACLFINFLSIVRFSKQLRQGVPYKGENWHALSHEQCFSKHRFLDICRCAFKTSLFVTPRVKFAVTCCKPIWNASIRVR